MSLSRTLKRRNRGKGPWYGFCAICVELMDPDELKVHMLLKHGIIVDEEVPYDRARRKGGADVVSDSEKA